MAVVGAAATVAQIIGPQHQFLRPIDGVATERCELAVAADAVEQRLAEVGFESADAAAQRGLCQEQGGCRLAERARLRQRNQVSQLDEGHGSELSNLCFEIIAIEKTMHWTFDHAAPTLLAEETTSPKE